MRENKVLTYTERDCETGEESAAVNLAEAISLYPSCRRAQAMMVALLEK